MFSILETETEDIEKQGNRKRPRTVDIRNEYEKLKRELEKREREKVTENKGRVAKRQKRNVID